MLHEFSTFHLDATHFHFVVYFICFFHQGALEKLIRTISRCAGPASHSSKNRCMISIFCTSHLDVQKSFSDFLTFLWDFFSLGCPTKVGFELMRTISWCAGPASHSPKNKPRPQGLLFARDVWISTCSYFCYFSTHWGGYFYFCFALYNHFILFLPESVEQVKHDRKHNGPRVERFC